MDSGISTYHGPWMFRGPHPPIFCLCFKPLHTEASPISFPANKSSACTTPTRGGRCSHSLPSLAACLRCRTRSFTCLHRPALLASHNRGGSPTGLSRNSQRKEERQLDETGTARGQMEEKAACRISSVTYLGKSCRRVPPPLGLSCPAGFWPH